MFWKCEEIRWRISNLVSTFNCWSRWKSPARPALALVLYWRNIIHSLIISPINCCLKISKMFIIRFNQISSFINFNLCSQHVFKLFIAQIWEFIDSKLCNSFVLLVEYFNTIKVFLKIFKPIIKLLNWFIVSLILSNKVLEFLLVFVVISFRFVLFSLSNHQNGEKPN